MKIYNRQRPNFGFESEGTGMIALALFVILLAFFIMLSGMTGLSFKKSDDVLFSVRQAFGVPQIVYFGGDGKALRDGAQDRSGQGTASLEDVAGAFEHEVPGLRAVLIKRSGVLKIDVPLPQMNRITGVTGAGGISTALKTMAAYINSHPSRAYRLTLRVHTRDGLSFEDAPSVSESMLSVWAKALVAAGVDPKHLVIGVGSGVPGAVSITVEPQGGR